MLRVEPLVHPEWTSEGQTISIASRGIDRRPIRVSFSRLSCAFQALPYMLLRPRKSGQLVSTFSENLFHELESGNVSRLMA